jgi:hypothetical protein
MIKYLPLLGMLTACSHLVNLGVPLPIYGEESYQFCKAECPKPEKTATAVSLMDSLLMEKGFPHIEAFERLDITWDAYTDGDYYGMTQNVTQIDIWDITPGDVKGSALCHELIHVALWWKYSDPDVDHNNILFDHNDGLPSVEEECKEWVVYYDL